MDSWSYKDIHIVFTVNEFNELLTLAEPDPSKRFSYRIVSTYHRDRHREVLQKKMKEILLDRLKTDPDNFRRNYEERDFYGEEAQSMFPYFLRKYGEITKIATFGKYIRDYEDPLGVSDIDENDELFYITILKWKRFFFKKELKIDNYISFRSSGIKRLHGKASHFILETEYAKILFSKKSIQLRLIK